MFVSLAPGMEMLEVAAPPVQGEAGGSSAKHVYDVLPGAQVAIPTAKTAEVSSATPGKGVPLDARTTETA